MKVHAVNTDQKRWARSSFLVYLGYFASPLLVYADHLSDAIEIAAEYGADQGWKGLVLPLDSEVVHEDGDPFEGEFWMYTEAGWLTSHEVSAQENPTPRQISDLHHGRA